ncbi:hypothetical protein D3C71_1597660 [compost metagenome]
MYVFLVLIILKLEHRIRILRTPLIPALSRHNDFILPVNQVKTQIILFSNYNVIYFTEIQVNSKQLLIGIQ